MRIEPIITEKTMELAKQGKYTFRVGINTGKNAIREAVSRLFGVDVIGVRTIKLHGEIKRTLNRRKKVIKPIKKAIVWLKEGQKLDFFESKKQ
jgi:large subunit ribosomal protein L23